jgi:peptidoglycan/xylan/chitin deacetylase (PgdA/CDA1 family)
MRLFNTIALGLTAALAVSADKIFHCTQPNTIALTFDDGPYEYTNELLDQLKDAKIKATFFINGYNWWKDLETDPEKRDVIKRVLMKAIKLLLIHGLMKFQKVKKILIRL